MDPRPNGRRLTSDVSELRLLVISHTPAMWGAQMRLAEYLPVLKAAGVSPTLLAPDEGPFADAFRHQGCDVTILDLGQRLGLRTEDDSRPGIGAMLSQLIEILGAARRLRPIIGQYDLVQSHSRTAHLEVVLAAKFARRPSVIDVHDVVRPGIGQRILRLAGRLSSLVLANSSSTAATLGPGRRNVKVVNPAVDLNRFTGAVARDQELRMRLGSRGDATLIGVVGRVDRDKRIELLIDALAELDRTDVELSVVGATHIAGAKYLDDLTAHANEKLPGRVTFAGAQSDMPEVMAAIDVLASVCTVEAFGRSILEAQASRTPVVAPDLLGVSDIVEDGSTGWLFEPEDVPDLAAALTRLLDSADRARIVEAANHQAKSFGIDGQGKILIDSYRALV